MPALTRRTFLHRLANAALAATLATALFAAGCGKDETPAGNASGVGTGGGAGPADPNKKLNLAFVTNNAANFWTIARAGVNKAVEEIPNISVEFKIPGDASALTQKQLVQDLLSKGVDGIAISPIDPSNQTQFLNEVASKALLITQDSDAPESNRAAYLGTNNVDAGKQAGELLKAALPNGGKIMVFVGSLDAQNARDRLEGIKQAIQGSKIEIVDTRTDGTDNVRAKANVQDTLVKYPEIAGLVGLWSYNGPAILTAVREAGKNGKVQIVCFDEEDETLQGVKAGDIYGTVVQQPFEFGRQSMTLMAKVLRGDKSAIPAGKQVFVPTLAITKDKVDEFSANLKQMLGK
jgi:ribose transport system substrate-binding protein